MNIREPIGESITFEEISSARAISILKYLAQAEVPYFKILDIRATEKWDILVIEVDVEVSQRRTVDIGPKEIVEISFYKSRDVLPIFRPLRDNFPLDILHVMLDAESKQPSLCLWEEPFEELRPCLTPFLLLDRLKVWLEKAADGVLHGMNQPLEPVIISSGIAIIIPADLGKADQRYVATCTEDPSQKMAIRFVSQDANTQLNKRPTHVLAKFKTPPVTHRAVTHGPKNLAELDDLLQQSGFDLRAELLSWSSRIGKDPTLLQSTPVLLIEFPKKRTSDGDVESVDQWGFMFTKMATVSEIGNALGAFVDASKYGVSARAILLNDSSEHKVVMQGLDVFAVNVHPEISSNDLALLSGYGQLRKFLITAIGVGALGSKVIELAARCGFGQWTILDKDIFLPHNVIRHVLGNVAIGDHKAEYFKEFINWHIPGNPIHETLVVDVKSPGEKQEMLWAAIENSDLVLDMSASVAVARQLCEHDSQRRCCSLFLNPSGQGLVLMLENSERTISLWDMEGAYYRALIQEDQLDGHLNNTDSLARYGNGCRDITAKVSGDQVSVLSGIAIRQFIQKSQSKEASICIWRHNIQSGEIHRIPLLTSSGIEIKSGGWRIRWNSQLVQDIDSKRKRTLPNETGGVLLGLVDFEHNMIVVAHSIDAPEDSVEHPYFFERGTTSLEIMESIRQKTAGQLRYLGEWHSHPNGVKASPSDNDEKLFQYLEQKFIASSEPYLMSIFSDDEVFTRCGLNGESNDMLFNLNFC